MNMDVINDAKTEPAERVAALKGAATSSSPSKKGEVNNHIHTVYSFSPYTPSAAALAAYRAGLEVAGSVDHDSIGAAEEMLSACDVVGLGCVVGFELRVGFKDTPFGDRKLNNPDSVGIAYMTVQCVGKSRIPEAAAFLAPIRKRRRERTQRMTAAVSDILMKAGVAETPLDFERDVVALSQYHRGGGLTERHLLAGVANLLMARYGRGDALLAALGRSGVTVPPKQAALIADAGNPHILFDVLGVLKSTLLERVFEQPDEQECIPAGEVIRFAKSIGAIPAYAYLGDVGESPTGDKKAEKFEDDFIEPLFDCLEGMGYEAVAYMPPRNTLPQLLRVQELCRKHRLMEISGVDINSSRQSFNCPEVLQPEFRHLIHTTWDLVKRQKELG